MPPVPLATTNLKLARGRLVLAAWPPNPGLIFQPIQAGPSEARLSQAICHKVPPTAFDRKLQLAYDPTPVVTAAPALESQAYRQQSTVDEALRASNWCISTARNQQSSIEGGG